MYSSSVKSRRLPGEMYCLLGETVGLLTRVQKPLTNCSFIVDGIKHYCVRQELSISTILVSLKVISRSYSRHQKQPTRNDSLDGAVYSTTGTVKFSKATST